MIFTIASWSRSIFICQGSGRAADILAYAYSQCEEKEVEVNDELEQKQKQWVAH